MNSELLGFGSCRNSALRVAPFVQIMVPLEVFVSGKLVLPVGSLNQCQGGTGSQCLPQQWLLQKPIKAFCWQWATCGTRERPAPDGAGGPLCRRHAREAHSAVSIPTIQWGGFLGCGKGRGKVRQGINQAAGGCGPKDIAAQEGRDGGRGCH